MVQRLPGGRRGAPAATRTLDRSASTLAAALPRAACPGLAAPLVVLLVLVAAVSVQGKCQSRARDSDGDERSVHGVQSVARDDHTCERVGIILGNRTPRRMQWMLDAVAAVNAVDAVNALSHRIANIFQQRHRRFAFSSSLCFLLRTSSTSSVA